MKKFFLVLVIICFIVSFLKKKQLNLDVNEEEELFERDKINDQQDVNGKIDINTSSKHELILVPGIGNDIANKLIDYKKNNGQFKSMEDLLTITGIGPKKLEFISKFIKI